MTFARLQGGAYTRMGRNLRERVWGTKSPCRFAAPPLTCGPALGLPPGYSGSSTPPPPPPPSVTASPCHLPPSGGKACGRAAQCAAPTIQPAQPGRAGEGTRPYEIRGTLRPFHRGRTLADPQAAFGRAPHPPPSGAPSPKGEGFRATARVAPTVGNEPGALARKRQAREQNRTSPNFPPTQAPSGAGRDHTQALLILRAGNFLPTSRGNPRKWGPGKAVLWT